MRAGHRGVFDDGHRGVFLAEHAVAERRRNQKLGFGDALRIGGVHQRFDASDGGHQREQACAHQQLPTCDHLKTP